MTDIFEIVKNREIDEIEKSLIKNRSDFFNTTKIKFLYDRIKNIHFTKSEAILTLAWMALFSGDNLSVYQLSLVINENELSEDSVGFFQDLKSLSGIFNSHEDRLKLSNMVISRFEKKPGFYLANAYLTHGQILVGLHNLREAVEFFEKSYNMFMKENMFFPASIAINNACLNLYRLGNIKKVIEKINNALLIASQFKSKELMYWDAIRLPLGMAYYEIGNYKLSKEELLKAGKAINDMDLIHMHGYLEIYLIRIYSITNDKKALEQLAVEMRQMFSAMNYPMMDIIMMYADVHLKRNLSVLSDRIVNYYHQMEAPNPLLFEILDYLFTKKIIDVPPMNKCIENIEKLRYEGDRVNLMISLLFLADRYHMDGQENATKEILNEVYNLYEQYDFKSALLLYDYEVTSILQKMFPYVKAHYRKKNTTLTEKERQILVLIGNGYDNSQIAMTLYISVGTVKWHINNIFSKLNVTNRVSALNEALKQNLL